MNRHPSLELPYISPPKLQPKALGRNEPCWCKSGRKYKHCHLNRDKDTELNPFEESKRNKKIAAIGLCLAPTDKGECGNDAIASHTVQREGGLAAISEAGHVLTVFHTYADLHKGNGNPKMNRIGVRKASTFPGMCPEHDASIFRPVEGSEIQLGHKEAFLLSYRSVLYEYQRKKMAADDAPRMRQYDRGLPFQQQVSIQAYMNVATAGLEAGLKSIGRVKKRYDEILLNGDFSAVRFLAYRFDGLLPYVVSGGFYPEWSFSGERLQKISRVAVIPEAATLTITSYGSGSVAILAWLPEEFDVAAKFAESLDRLPDCKKAGALLEAAFEYSENVFVRESWWKSLNSEHVKRLLGRVHNGTSLSPHKAVIGENAISLENVANVIERRGE